MERARPRWLCVDGRFRLDPARAWLVLDAAVAAQRLQRWLIGKQRPIAYLKRMQLVHGCSISEAESRVPDHSSVRFL